MREIKYKAYVKELNLVLPVLSIQFDFKKAEVPATYSKHIDTEYFNFEQVELMQYTGLNDAKGNEVYEGDILKVNKLTFESSGPLPTILNVKNYSGMFQLYRDDENLMGLHLGYIEECEVIGNVYENRNLLDGSDGE